MTGSGHDLLKNWSRLRAALSRAWALAFVPVERRQGQEKCSRGQEEAEGMILVFGHQRNETQGVQEALLALDP